MNTKHTSMPENEVERLEALRCYGVLDSEPEEGFDRVTRMASRLLNVPICLVSLIDKDRQWFKSRQGIDATETPRDIAFCTYAILRNEVMVVPNAMEDPRFRDNPLVVGEPFIRFYAGAPLTNRDAMLNRDHLGLPVIDASPETPHERRLIHLAFLAPELQHDILLGKQPRRMTLATLLKNPLPLLWQNQFRMFRQ